MINRKLKILEITAFSSGICGVWTRVLAEASLLAKKGYEMHVFSSDIHRGEGKGIKAKSEETINNVKIRRFSPYFSFGDNTYFWNFKKEALSLKPDIIICHAYRQYYSTKALEIAQQLNIPCFLVTHAPFLDKKLRSFKLNLAVWIYDTFIGKKIINKYNKILAITKWEIPHLLKLGAEKNKIVYIPNGVPEEFFKIPLKKPKNKTKKLLFFGRIAPIKDLETLIFSLLKIKSNFILDIVGPSEPEYKKKIETLVSDLKLQNKVRFFPAIYDLNEKISLIDSHDVFILPSKREGMPQALIEVMAREKIVISSTTDGGKEIIQDKKNGFLFDIGNSKQLAETINKILKMPDKLKLSIQKQARKSIEQFSWTKIIEKLENTILR